MTDCPQSSESLSDYVDGLLEPADRDALRAHLGQCESCRGLVDDLTRLKDAARSLGPIEPPAHIFENIQATLASMPSAKRQARTQWLGLAAALVLVTAGAYLFTRVTSPAPPAASVNDSAHAGTGNANAPATVETVEQELAKAEQHYQNAITQLEQVVKDNGNALPADAAAKLQVSLPQVDKFIAESRAALVSEPQNDPARDSLFAALRKKVEILQETVALMGAMQRGDRETTAKMMDGKKG
jgi:anti-sigma factor RsiW